MQYDKQWGIFLLLQLLELEVTARLWNFKKTLCLLKFPLIDFPIYNEGLTEIRNETVYLYPINTDLKWTVQLCFQYTVLFNLPS